VPLHSPCACVAARCVLAVSEINFCQPQRTLRYTKETLVRDHSFNFWCVCIAHQNRLAEFLFSLLRLRGQDVAQMRMSALYFSGCGFLKPLRGAFMGLQLRHISSGEPSIFCSQFSVLNAKKSKLAFARRPAAFARCLSWGPGWRVAYCLPAGDETPQCFCLARL